MHYSVNFRLFLNLKILLLFKGSMHINLNGTGLSFSPSVSWKEYGQNAVNRIFITSVSIYLNYFFLIQVSFEIFFKIGFQ